MASQADASEDGEVLEEPSAPSNSHDLSFVPVRRPRRAKEDIDFSSLHAKYQALGREFKFSGEARINSTYPRKNDSYRALRKPPPPSSPYCKHANILGRLELVEGLMCFAYAFWCSDTQRGRSSVTDWKTMASFMGYCKGHWSLTVSDDRERAISGLV